MTGQPGHRTMEMNGGSSVPYLARTPCIPSFFTLFNIVGNRKAFRLPGEGVSTWPIGCGTPSPFSEIFPRGEHAKWRCDTPPLSAILVRYPIKTRQMGAIPPSTILSRKGVARYGGVSRTGPLSHRQPQVLWLNGVSQCKYSVIFP